MTIESDFRQLNNQLDDFYDKYDQTESTMNTERDTKNGISNVTTIYYNEYFNYESAYNGIEMGPNPSGDTSFLHGRSRMLMLRNGLVSTIFYQMMLGSWRVSLQIEN